MNGYGIMRLLALLALLSLSLLTGCDGDDPVEIETARIPTILPSPDSESQVVENFRTSYEEMEYNPFVDLLHPDFTMILQNSTIQEFPDLGPTLDRADEMRIASRMFSGQPVTDPDGALVQAISGISFDIFEQQTIWTDTQPNDAFPNARFALYDVTFLFDRPGASTLKVVGQIKFYVTGRDTVVNGEAMSYWQMIGQQDLTNSGKAAAGSSWGEVKAQYR